MKIGFIGLGRMGGNMVLNLKDKGNSVVAFNRSSDVTKKFERKGIIGVYSLEELIGKLPKQKIIWLMIKAGKPVDDQIGKLARYLKKGDIIIDGGNSYFKDSIRRADNLKRKGISFLDVGTSGGMEGARYGACMMIGGEKKIFKKTEKLFRDMCVKDGYGYMGVSGSGHFVKMVHNGIEYGMMSAIGEGLSAVDKFSKKFKIDMDEVSKVYSHGSIIESRLIDWARIGMKRPYFNKVSGEVPKGETEMEMVSLIKMAEMPVLKQAVRERKKTRKKSSYFGKIISVMRNEFGGHSFEKK